MSAQRQLFLVLLVSLLGSVPVHGDDDVKKKLPKFIGKIVRLDPAFDELIPADAKIEVLAGGFD